MLNIPLLQKNTVAVDENVTMLANRYTLSDENGCLLGQIRESRSVWRFIVQRSFAPFTLTCFDAEDRPVATMRKGWALLRPRYSIVDADGKLIASIRSRITLIRPKADIFYPDGRLMGSMEGDWVAWNFFVTAPDGKVLAQINKRFNGLVKEIFTTADKYVVAIPDEVCDPDQRMAILFTACAIDMVLKESNN